MTTHIPCASCNSLNRIPNERLTDAPICGKCRAALLPEHPIELNASNFARVVQKSDLPVVVDFWAPWCGPCKMMAPTFAQAAQTFQGKAILAKLNTEDFPALGGQFNIRSIPSLLVFRNGKERARQAGALDAGRLQQYIEQNL